MKKCIILLPTQYNDKSEVPPDIINRILRDIDELFDGHTIAGIAEGTYRMLNGNMATDPSLMVWIAVDQDKIGMLKKMASRFARILKQETIYFEVTDSEINFIGPDLES
jgi:predicted RNA methylase